MAQWIKNLLLGVLIGFIFLCQRFLKVEKNLGKDGKHQGKISNTTESGMGVKGFY